MPINPYFISLLRSNKIGGGDLPSTGMDPYTKQAMKGLMPNEVAELMRLNDPSPPLAYPEIVGPMPLPKSSAPISKSSPPSKPKQSKRKPTAPAIDVAGSIPTQSRETLELGPDNRLTLKPVQRQTEEVIPLAPYSVSDKPQPQQEPVRSVVRRDFPLDGSELKDAKKLDDLPSDLWLRYIAQLGKATAVPIYGHRPQESLSELANTLYDDLQKQKEIDRRERENAIDRYHKFLKIRGDEEALRFLPIEKQQAIDLRDLDRRAAQLKLDALPEDIRLEQQAKSTKIDLDLLEKRINEVKALDQEIGQQNKLGLSSIDSPVTKTLHNLIKSELGLDTSNLTGYEVLAVWDQLKEAIRAKQEREKPKGGLTEYQKMSIEDRLRNELNKYSKSDSDYIRNYNIAKSLYEDSVKNNKNPDLTKGSYNRAAVLYLFNKMLDENSVVKESEVKMTQDYGGLIEKARNYMSHLSGEGVITKETFADMLRTIENISKYHEKAFANKVKLYKKIAESRELNKDVIFGPEHEELLKKYGKDNQETNSESIPKSLPKTRRIDSIEELNLLQDKKSRSPIRKIDSEDQL